jgi:DNA-binding CsgD family transcriptional regulator
LETRRFITFLNSLVVGEDVARWSDCFCRGIMKLLGDVDDVSFRVIFSADLHTPKGRDQQLLITMAHRDEAARLPDFTVSHKREDRLPHQLLIDTHLQDDPQLHRKFELYGYDYFYENGEYLGSIVLWRARHRREISPETMELMRALEPFFVFALSDAVARYRYFQPAGATFGSVIDRIVDEGKLTPREQEALILHLYGIPYDVIAAKLHITVSAVKKRVLQIHRKTGVTSHAELFARYFSAMLPPSTADRPECGGE